MTPSVPHSAVPYSAAPYARSPYGSDSGPMIVGMVAALTFAMLFVVTVFGALAMTPTTAEQATANSDTSGAQDTSDTSDTSGASPSRSQVVPVSNADVTYPLTSPAMTPDPFGVLMTYQVANQVVAQYWAAHEKARAAGSIADLKTLTVGAADVFERSLDQCDCVHPWRERKAQEVSILLTRQTAYPLTFVAVVRTAGAPDVPGLPYGEILTFVRAREREPWRVSFINGAPLSTDVALPRPALGADGFARGLDSLTGAQRHQVAGVMPALSAHLARAKMLSKSSTNSDQRRDLLDSPTFELSGSMASTTMYLLGDESWGTVAGYEYATSSSSFAPESAQLPAGVVLAGSRVLICDRILAKHHFKAASLPLQQRADGLPFGRQLKAGSYRAVTVREYLPTCAYASLDPAVKTSVVVGDGSFTAKPGLS